MTETYEGKAKVVTVRSDSEVAVFFKDDATAFNAQKKAQFADKGALNCAISRKLFDYLGAHGVRHHMLRALDERTLLCMRARMFALEVVVRFRIAGSLQKRTGLPLGTVCASPVVEFYYKRDDLGDPMVNQDHIRLLDLATPEEVTLLSQLGLTAAQHVHDLFARADIQLWDLKFEFGKTAEGIVLADEISPDTCRFREASGRILDKDLFRLDAGDLIVGYREILHRLDRALAHKGD